jgi:cyclopropane fatty-acyl-phospholipid synthase-like methyltransferase
MSEYSRPYAIHSDEECDRLELQARLANIEGHLRYLPVSPGDRVLDVGCGSGSMSRLIARSYPQADVTGVDLREQYLDFALGRAREEDKQNLTFRYLATLQPPADNHFANRINAMHLKDWFGDVESDRRSRFHALAPPNRGSLKQHHILGTHVPVEEPSTASEADILSFNYFSEAEQVHRNLRAERFCSFRVDDKFHCGQYPIAWTSCWHNKLGGYSNALHCNQFRVAPFDIDGG